MLLEEGWELELEGEQEEGQELEPDLQEYVNAQNVVTNLQKPLESPVAKPNVPSAVFRFVVLTEPFLKGGLINGIDMRSQSGPGGFKR